jgi:nucleoid DNA-binding protein
MAKKAAPKAAAKPAAADKSAAAAKPATKTEIFSALADKTQLSKKDVAAVFDGLFDLVGKELGKKGPGLFVIPGMLKIKVVHKPATKARPGFNPATKEQITIKAKPARKAIKILPLKALKDLI